MTRASSDDTQLMTVGDLARATGLAQHRVEYLIRSRRIAPTQRAGSYRLFDQAALDRIRGEIGNKKLRGGVA